MKEMCQRTPPPTSGNYWNWALGCETEYLIHPLTVVRLLTCFLFVCFPKCAFQLLSPTAIINPHRLTYGNITTHRHAQLRAKWTPQARRLLRAFYTRVPVRGGATSRSTSDTVYGFDQSWEPVIRYSWDIKSRASQHTIRERSDTNLGGGGKKFVITAVYSGANWKSSYFTTTPKGTIKCQLEIIIACVTITLSDQDARRHYHPLISEQVSAATHIWKAQHSKILLDKCNSFSRCIQLLYLLPPL
jgi:hypothetical protein